MEDNVKRYLPLKPETQYLFHLMRRLDVLQDFVLGSSGSTALRSQQQHVCGGGQQYQAHLLGSCPPELTRNLL